MWEQLDRIMRDATSQFMQQVVIFLPGVLAALGLLLAALIASVIARIIVARILRSLEFDRRMEHLGAVTQITWPALGPSLFIARSVQWAILLFGVLISLTALNAAMPSRFALSVFQYVPHLLAALLIGVLGWLVARFLGQSVLIGAVNMRLQSARLLSLAVKWLVLVVTAAMVLDHLGIGRHILLLAFGILFGGVVLAAALAIGLGARDAVRKAIEQRLTEPPSDSDHLPHV
jgi:hypothetical protein